jgi:hypothetical protein
MITVEQYFGPKIFHADATIGRRANATVLLSRVNAALVWVSSQGYQNDIDPDTGTQISGSKGGAGDGGFRLQGATTGKKRSKHKEGLAVDVYDPLDLLDGLFTDAILAKFDLYREAPDATKGWIHLQSAAPTSGKRTFNP